MPRTTEEEELEESKEWRWEMCNNDLQHSCLNWKSGTVISIATFLIT